jgi:peptidoglycan hydrolase-like protein with peptidoglycan-binding domain
VVLRRIVIGLVAMAATASAVVLPTSAAYASTPICTTIAAEVGTGGAEVDLPATSSGSSTCFLAQGDNSDAVLDLQANLNDCYKKGLTLDGDFGPATRTALVAVQRTIGATPDGGYGTQTRGLMLWSKVGPGCTHWVHD